MLERDGRLIGYADVDSTREDPPLWWCDVKVAPDVAAAEVVPELVALAGRARGQGQAAGLDLGRGRPHRRRVRDLGFVPVRHSYRMEIDLGGDEREPTWPEGISVRTATEADHRLVYDTVIEVWRDTNDTYDETFEEWAHWQVESSAYDPSLWFLAFADGELAGFSICRQEPIDPNAGYVGMLGVRRAGGGRVSARRCSCTLSPRSAGAASRARRSASTRRARPARPGCTSARG